MSPGVEVYMTNRCESDKMLHWLLCIYYIGDLAAAIRNNTDIHFGLYYSLFEWFHPLFLKDKANNFTTQEYIAVNFLWNLCITSFFIFGLQPARLHNSCALRLAIKLWLQLLWRAFYIRMFETQQGSSSPNAITVPMKAITWQWWNAKGLSFVLNAYW